MIDYSKYTKTYVVVHYTGFGLQEAPYRDMHVAFETNDETEAHAKANEYKMASNPPDSLRDSWYENKYEVRVNPNSEFGKKLANGYIQGKNEVPAAGDLKARGYVTEEIYGIKFTYIPHGKFDNPDSRLSLDGNKDSESNETGSEKPL